MTKAHLELLVSVETSSLSPSGTPTSSKAHLLIPPKQFYQMETKYSNIRAYGFHSHSNHHISLPDPRSLSHITMQNIFCPALKVSSLSVSILSQGNLLTNPHVKAESKSHTPAYNGTEYTSPFYRGRDSEESKHTPYPVSFGKGLRWLFLPPSLLTATLISWADSTAFLDRAHISRITKPIQASPPQRHKMAGLW